MAPARTPWPFSAATISGVVRPATVATTRLVRTGATRAVDVHVQPGLATGCDQPARLLDRRDQAAAQVVRILEDDQADLRPVEGAGLQGPAHVVGGEPPVLRPDRVGRDPGEHGHARQLVLDDVCARLAEHLLA